MPPKKKKQISNWNFIFFLKKFLFSSVIIKEETKEESKETPEKRSLRVKAPEKEGSIKWN